MIYQIELTLLEKLCPVFSDSSFLTYVLSLSSLRKEELLLFLNTEYEGSDNNMINLVAELKYLEKEKTLRTVSFDLGALEEGKWPISIGTSTYIHALLKDKKSIPVELHASPEQFNRYKLDLGLSEMIFENPVLVVPEKSGNWLTPEDLHDNAWKNIEWLKTALKVNSQILKYVDKSVWYEDEFLECLVVYCDGELYHLPDEFFNNLYVLSFFTILPDIFYEAWCHIYAKWYHENQYPDITEKINEQVFHNKERMLDMLGRGKCIEFYPYMSESLKVDLDILTISCQFFHDNLSSFALEEHFPESFFTDDAALKCYLLNLYPQSLPRLNESYRQKLFAHWIHDKEKVIDYLSVISQHGYGESVKVLASFYPYFSEEMKNDKTLMIYLLEESPEYYLLLDNALQETLLPQLIARLSRNSGTILEKFLPVIKKHSHIIYDTSDSQIQKLYVRLFPQLMLNAPVSWQYDPELILAMGSHFLALDSFLLPAHVWSELCKSETFCLALINQVGAETYKLFPLSSRLNPLIVLQYLGQVKLKNLGYSLIEKSLDSRYNAIPQALWVDRDFCLAALLQAEKNAQYVPPEIWHDTDFILKVAQAVQDKKLKYSLFSYAPVEIDQFFQLYRAHKTQLYDFLSAFIWQKELQSTLNKKEPERKKGKI